MRCLMFALAVALPVMLAISAARAQSNGGYDIMRPEPGVPAYEPWLAPKYKSPRGVKHRRVPKIEAEPPARATVPPPIVSPRTGRALQNLPATVGAGPGGSETSQDKALRCAHQAGGYGSATGGGSYLGSCINQ
jgi:hypothetical protein